MGLGGWICLFALVGCLFLCSGGCFVLLFGFMCFDWYVLGVVLFWLSLVVGLCCFMVCFVWGCVFICFVGLVVD